MQPSYCQSPSDMIHKYAHEVLQSHSSVFRWYDVQYEHYLSIATGSGEEPTDTLGSIVSSRRSTTVTVPNILSKLQRSSYLVSAHFITIIRGIDMIWKVGGGLLNFERTPGAQSVPKIEILAIYIHGSNYIVILAHKCYVINCKLTCGWQRAQ